jgi:hypothetical protein
MIHIFLVNSYLYLLWIAFGEVISYRSCISLFGCWSHWKRKSETRNLKLATPTQTSVKILSSKYSCLHFVGIK